MDERGKGGKKRKKKGACKDHVRRAIRKRLSDRREKLGQRGLV